jgi:hypothetical protein
MYTAADLAIAERHVAEGASRIARVLRLIAQRQADQYSIEFERDLLDAMIRTQELFRQHRDEIARYLKSQALRPNLN